MQLVAKDSPAERAGLEVGDVITEIDGKLLMSASDRHHVSKRVAASRW